MDANGEWVLSIATANPGVLVKSSCNQSDYTRRINIERILRTYCREAGRTDNKHSNENQRLSFTTKESKNPGPA